MNKKLLLVLIGVIFSVISINYLTNLKNNNSNIVNNHILKLRKQHQQFLENSPFKESLILTKSERKSIGIPPNKYFERQWELTMDPSTGKPHPERLFLLQESLRLNSVSYRNPGSAPWNNWEERGPNNVGGRTRAIMFDPNDLTNKRIFAGGVSGGLWVNDDITNEDSAWSEVDIPQNLAVSVITFDPNNTNIFYLGTGESYVGGDANGNGLWKSENRGVTWAKIFGGITGETTFESNVKLTVNSPASIAGNYQVTSAAFGPSVTSISGDLVLADDSSELPTEACNAITNNIEMDGKIAIVERGNCTFVSKVKKAQAAGATAVVVVNNIVGPPITLGGDEDGTVTIPSIMISKEEGLAIIQQLENGVNITIEAVDSPFSGSYVTPGIQHINDIKVRDLGNGNSEVYVAVGGSYYTSSTPSSLLGAEQEGLYKSLNEGASWSKITLPLTLEGNEYTPNDIEIGIDNTIWVSTIRSILYGDGGGTVLSSNDGVSFSVIQEIADGDRTQISISKLNSGVVYVLAELSTDDKLYLAKTEDSFGTITVLDKPNDADTGIPAEDFTRGQAFYDLMIEVDPANDDIVYVGGIDLFRTEDGGVVWDQISKWSDNNNLGGTSVPMVHADQHTMVFNPENSNQAVFGNDGGVYYGISLSDASTTTTAISSRNKNYNTLQFYKGAIGSDVASEKLLAGAQDNGSHFINNATSGINSSIKVTGGDGAYTFIDKDNEYMITSYVYNNYYYLNYETGNFVYNIVENDDDGDFINPAALDSDNNILYASGTNRIYRYKIGLTSATTATLQNDLLASSPTAFKTSTFTTTTLFVGTERGKLLKLEDANDTSQTWTNISGPNFYGSISCIELGATENDIMVTFHNYGVKSVFFTQDGGDIWQSKEGDLPDIPVKAILMNPLDANEVILGTDLGVWETTNFNDVNPSWVQSQNGMKDVQVTSFDLRTSDNTVLASTYGRGLFTAKFTDANYTNDDDSDTVINGLDLCPNTLSGEPVDANGCSNGQLDDDSDGVQNSIDECPGTEDGKTVDGVGCVIFTLPSNNFNIEVTSETCPNKENGQVTIVATESYSYTTTINGVPYTFSNTSNLTSNPLPVGVYDFCISVSGESYEQCFVIEIEASNSAKATTSVSSNKVSIEMTAGTAPYTILVNGLEQLKTSASIFLVAIKHGDVIEVKTAKTCEGVYSKTIELLEGIVAYPNPTNGTFEITLPVSQKEVTIELYTIHSQLISIKTYPIVYGKVQLTIEDQPTGLYISKVQLDRPVTLKIVKQ